jgi:hypothetical protein
MEYSWEQVSTIESVCGGGIFENTFQILTKFSGINAYRFVMMKKMINYERFTSQKNIVNSRSVKKF